MRRLVKTVFHYSDGTIEEFHYKRLLTPPAKNILDSVFTNTNCSTRALFTVSVFLIAREIRGDVPYNYTNVAIDILADYLNLPRREICNTLFTNQNLSYSYFEHLVEEALKNNTSGIRILVIRNTAPNFLSADLELFNRYLP